MAATAILAVQNIKHAEFGGMSLVFEYFFVTVAACQPFSMLPVREFHGVHFAGIGEQYVQVQYLGLGARMEADARLDKAILDRVDPVDLIAAAIARQQGQRFCRILQ
ncbi:MAG TPA: hypothetical protein VMJ33_10620 [Gallionella sp.]|nr:hypothetical protein [Gallionella sp.]